MKTAYLDIETDTLDATVIRLVMVKWTDSSGIVGYADFTGAGDLHGFLETMDFDMIVGHNIIGFDDDKLRKLWGIPLNKFSKIVLDTLLMSKLLDFNRSSHSMSAYGMEFGVLKGEVSDYATCLMSELYTYCKNDLDLTQMIHEHLCGRAETLKVDASVFIRECKVAEIVAEQVREGVPFDTERALGTAVLIVKSMDHLEDKVNPILPEMPLAESKIKYPPKLQFKKDGTPSANAVKYFGTLDKRVCNYYFTHPCGTDEKLPWHRPLVTHEKITMSNQKQLKQWLMDEGWVPTMWNKVKDIDDYGKITWRKTSPKLYDDNKEPCPALARMGFTHAEDVSKWLTLRSRKNVISSDKGTGWVHNPRLKVDRRISSEADTLGANTGRFTHKVIANVPRVSSFFGKEMRALFMCPEGMSMVGWDASKLEACVEAHYLRPIDKAASDRLMAGSIHDDNAELFGVDRDKAKEIKYALTYGCQPRKLADITGWDTSKAKHMYNQFWKVNEALRLLKEKIIKQWKHNDKRFIRGLDGRVIYTRSEHSLLNALFQSGGAIIMKEAMIIADRNVHEIYSGRAAGLIRYHDEEQWWAEPEIAEHVGKIGVLSIKLAGFQLGVRVPLSGEYKVGTTWADTH
jgi:DNA polymerase-1